MASWRKLHSKILDSQDFNNLPSDFDRLVWVLLPLCLDREGRGLDHTAWLKSKLFPMRTDVTLEQIESAMTTFATAGMIERYKVDEKAYFWVPSWSKYQKVHPNETASSIPRIPRVHKAKPVTPKDDQECTKNEPKALLDRKIKNKKDREIEPQDISSTPPADNGKQSTTRQIQAAFEQACGYPVPWKEGEAIAAKWLSDHGYTAAEVSACYAHMKAQPFWRDKTLRLRSIQNQIGDYRKQHPNVAANDGIDYKHYGFTPSGKLVKTQ